MISPNFKVPMISGAGVSSLRSRFRRACGAIEVIRRDDGRRFRCPIDSDRVATNLNIGVCKD